MKIARQAERDAGAAGEERGIGDRLADRHEVGVGDGVDDDEALAAAAAAASAAPIGAAPAPRRCGQGDEADGLAATGARASGGCRRRSSG